MKSHKEKAVDLDEIFPLKSAGEVLVSSSTLRKIKALFQAKQLIKEKMHGDLHRMVCSSH